MMIGVSGGSVMSRHFLVLVFGSVVFLVLFVRETVEHVYWSSAPGDAAAKNTSHLVGAVQLLGVYGVFAVLVLGHGLLRRPTRPTDEDRKAE